MKLNQIRLPVEIVVRQSEEVAKASIQDICKPDDRQLFFSIMANEIKESGEYVRT